MSKNYICFVNDHSASMGSLAKAAAADFNTNINAIKDSANREMLDTVVSVAEVTGYGGGLTVTVSNPHVLKPVENWFCGGGTPLWTNTLAMIEMLKKLPDINKPNVSVLILLTTDGEATDSYVFADLQKAMQEVLATGRWTFVARVPTGMNAGSRQALTKLGIPEGNIQSWSTTAAGLAESTVQTTAAMSNYFTQRSAGAKSSSSFYADASKVDITALEDISKKVSLYVVPPQDNGVEIRPFILRHLMEYLKGSAFYQLTKTESKVSHTKQVLVRDRASGKIFHGPQARKMIGLPSDRNARLHPGDHKNFDLFIQSESVNRKLVGGTGVVYWKEIGVPFTEADLAYLQPKQPAAAPVTNVVQLPAVAPTNKPTPSPIPVTPMFEYFTTREEARQYCASVGLPQSKIVRRPDAPKGRKWAVPTKALKKAA